MVDVIIAPRREDPLSDVEAVINTGYMQLRAAYWNVTSGQWISDVWSDPIPLTGVAITVKLDASTAPYDLHLRYNDGQNEWVERNESRIVVASAIPVKWEALEQVGGAGAPAPPPSDLTARVTSLETTVAGLGAGSAPASLATLTGASTDGKALIGGTNTYATMRTLLSVATAASVTTAQATADAAIPTSFLGAPNGAAKLSADGLSVLRADGTPFSGGAVIGTVAGSATDAARFAAHVAHTVWSIFQGQPEYTNHPVTQQVCHYFGSTDPGNNGDKVLGGGGLAPGDLWTQTS